MLKSLLTKLRSTFEKIWVNSLIRNMLIVGGIALVAKLFGFFKETLIASFFGLSEVLDTYYIAILIPTFIQSVFIGTLKQLFIPNYVTEIQTSGHKGSFQTFTFLSITFLILVLSALSFIFVQFYLEFLFPGHESEYYELIRRQFFIVLPCLFFWGYASFLSGILEIQNKFLLSSITSLFTPVVIIICLIFFNNIFGDLVLVYGLSLGSFVSFLYLLLINLRQKSLSFAQVRINANIKIMLQQYPAKVTSGLLTGINPFVDQFFAAQLVVGSISAIQYGTKIPAFTIGILILAIGNVLLPHFSKLVIEDLKKAYFQLFKVLKVIFVASALVTVIIFIFSEDIVRILFERNEFTSNDTSVVSRLQQISLIYVPFYLCTIVCVKFLTSINENKFMAWVSFWNLLLNLVLNFVLVKYYAVYGLLLATTIVYIACSIIYVSYTYKKFKITTYP